jgi:ubiquinone/menaquinone biosynthesis C-methylase UbiE
MADTTPDYDGYQSSFHEAFRPELYRVLDALPVWPGSRVLDVPCGNGFYTRRLAERLTAGTLVAVDVDDVYLSRTRAAVAGTAAATEVRKADAYRLPYPDAAFDLVWCAQSLISLDPEPAVREMRRVTAADGTAAILEVDEFHHVLLPWPVELEAALPQAVHAASVQKYGDGAKLAPARRLRRVLRQAGFRSVRRMALA